ncbi:leucine-rich repeat serine/threonine-protein kinase 2-like [Glandiceps talaboti]
MLRRDRLSIRRLAEGLKTRRILTQLRDGSSTPDELYEAITLLIERVEYNRNVRILEDNDIQTMLLHIMKTHQSDPRIQQVCCMALSTLMERSCKLRSGIVKARGDRYVMEAVDLYINNQDFVEAAMETVGQLVTMVTVHNRVLQKNTRKCIMKTMATFPDNHHLQIQVFKALTQLLKNGNNIQLEVAVTKDYNIIITVIDNMCECTELLEHAFNALGILFTSGDCTGVFLDNKIHIYIIKALDKTESTPVIKSGYNLVTQLAYNGKACSTLTSANVHVSAMGHMKMFHDDLELHTSCCCLLLTLSRISGVQCQLVDSGVCEAVLQTMDMFVVESSDVNVLIVCMRTLEKLGAVVQTVDEDLGMKSKGRYNWLLVLHKIMEKHEDRESLQEAACNLLSTLLRQPSQLINYIGENENQVAIHIDVFACLMYHAGSTKIFLQVCNIVYALASENERISSRLMEQGVYVPILHGLQRFQENQRIQLAGWKALRGLVKSCSGNKKTGLTDQSLIRSISQMLMEHSQNLDIFEEVICVMANIISIEEANCQLKDDWVLQTIQMCMQTYVHSPVVQLNGIIILRELVNETRLSDKSSCFTLTQLIIKAMKTFEGDEDLQMEAWLTIEHLTGICAEVHDSIGEVGYSSLFAILYQHSENKNLLNLARKCITGLRNIQDMLDFMFLSKSKTGSMEEVTCLLQLGANVNFGEGRNTPLCNSCRRSSREMTQLIINEGGSGMNTALTVCLQQDNYDMIGLLLGHIGIEKKIGSISWNNLELNLLDTRWFSHIEPDTYPSNTASRKQRGSSSSVEHSCSEPERLPHLNISRTNSIGYFPSLKKLDLSRNCIKYLPTELPEVVPNLEELNLHGNKFVAFPVQLLKTGRLRYLNLSSNEITADYGDKEEMKSSLTHLDLSNNNLKKMPTFVTTCLPCLETLSMAGNSLQRLPVLLTMLPKLTKLNLSNNKLKKVPGEFLSQLRQLQTLELKTNELESLPEDISERLVNLTTVNLAVNRLAAEEPFYVPTFVLKLPNLKRIDLSHNGLRGSPEPSHWYSNCLKEIHLSNNNISELNMNDGVRKWKSLQTLVISHNKLQELPKELGQLSSLTSIDFSHNEDITRIPDELGNLQQVWQMPLHGLKLDLYPVVTKGTTRDIIAFLYGRLKMAVPNSRMKLMVVGFAGRGKTTLLKRLQRRSLPQVVATVGIEVEDWATKKTMFKKLTGKFTKCEKYSLSTYDFAGQEEFHSMHPIFFSERSLYLVVYDASKGPKEIHALKPWLLTIHARAPGSPVIIVGTHEDKIPEEGREEYTEEMLKHISRFGSPDFPYINFQGHFWVCGTVYNEKLKELKKFIFQVIDEYKVGNNRVIGQMIPHSYVKLEEAILDKGKVMHVLKHEQLIELVNERGIQLDEHDLPHAIRYLHQFGVMLHYEDPVLHLRDLYFINPGWLCRMMARIVTVREINPFIDKNGILKKNDLRILLKECDLSLSEYQGLMEKFEIVVPKDDHELLVPCKMPKNRPDMPLPEPNKRGVLTRLYKMQYTPIGFWSKLIARLILFTRTVIEEADIPTTLRAYWKEGIYIQWSKKSSFLVEAVLNDPDCFQIIVPDSRDGRRLLGYVVDHTDDLIDEWYPGLGQHACIYKPVRRLVPCRLCQEDRSSHLYSIEELTRLSKEGDVISCPNKDENVLIKDMAPDVMLEDLDALKLDYLEFNATEGIQLGEGAFGKVFRSELFTQDIAVKVFSEDARGHFLCHRQLRQEIGVLQRLSHMSIVSVIGVGIRPNRVLVMELATLGSLRTVMKERKSLCRIVRHRIALQVAEGLQFLHAHRVIYRDLKPGNVLVFSLSINDLVNAKISDYGISRFATPLGLTSNEGTPGYTAPEVTEKDILYDNKVDIYSFGILLYELVVYKMISEMPLCQEELIPNIPFDGCTPWPDVENLIIHCIQRIPEKRPTSDGVLEALKSAELLCMKGGLQMDDGLEVQAAAFRTYNKESHSWSEIWIAGNRNGKVAVCRINTSRTSRDGKVSVADLMMSTVTMTDECNISFICLENDIFILGVDRTLLIGHSGTKKCESKQLELSDPVLCLQYYDGYDTEGAVFAGLTNGCVVMYSIDRLKSGVCEPTICIVISRNANPVQCMTINSNKLWIGCGDHVMTMKPTALSSTTCELDETMDIDHRDGLITHIAVGEKLWLSRINSSEVEAWHLDANCHPCGQASRICCSDVIRSHSCEAGEVECFVSSLLLQTTNYTLWVGTSNGCVILVDTSSFEVIDVIRRHTGPVRQIISSPMVGSELAPCVATIGTGFISYTGSSTIIDKESTYALLWEGNTGTYTKDLTTYKERRQHHVTNVRQSQYLMDSND